MPQLNTLAYCCPSHRGAVAKAAGVEPLTCPPLTLQWLDPGMLAGRDLLYLSLHGIPGQPYWYGDDNITALALTAFKDLDLTHTVIFVANCHLDRTPFKQTILDRKPRALVGGAGTNYTRANTLIGAHLLGFHFRRAIERQLTPAQALTLAKHHVNRAATVASVQLITAARSKDKTRLKQDIAANRDALNFEVYT